MLEKIQNSWKLAKECWRVLMLDKEMLMFPVLGTVTSILILGLISYPFWASGYFEQTELARINISSNFLITGFLKFTFLSVICAFLVNVVMTFYNTGLITCAFIRMRGGDPIVTDGLQIAVKRLPQILAWAAVVSSVGLLLSIIKGKNNFLRSLASSMLGLGWRVASFFTIPVIVAEKKGAIDALKRSGELVKKNWGEALTIEVGLSILAYPALIPTFLLFGLSTYVYDALPMLGLALGAITVTYTFLVIILFSTLDAIAKAALYMVSSDNQSTVNFDKELLENIFKRNNPETVVLT